MSASYNVGVAVAAAASDTIQFAWRATEDPHKPLQKSRLYETAKEAFDFKSYDVKPPKRWGINE